MAAGFQREIRKHAGIPDSAARSLAEKRLIANIKTVTGGTDKRADAAAQAGVGNLSSRNPCYRKIASNSLAMTS